MTPDAQAVLTTQLMLDEGLRLYAYQDALGFATIGYGRLIDRRRGGGISKGEAAYLLQNDVSAKLAQLAPFTWFSSQDDVRQAALANMAFNLGLEGLLHFPKFLVHMLAKEYPQAVAELVGSGWHQQTGVRAERVMKLIETGAWS